MKDKEITEFRVKLEEMKNELLNDSDETVQEMRNDASLYADPTDRASMETDNNNLLRIRDRERKLLSKIDEALIRLHNKSYGECEECGENIDIERLKIRPVTTFCVRCKEKLESRED